MAISLSRTDAIGRIIDNKVVPVFSHPDIDVCKKVVDLTVQARWSVFEFTCRVDKKPEDIDLAKSMLEQLIEYAEKQKYDLLFGAGTVRRKEHFQPIIDTGAGFIVGPNTVPEGFDICATADVPYSAG